MNEYITIRVTRDDAKVLSDLLDMASNQFSKHGSNDYALENTPSNQALVSAAEKWNSGESYPLNISKDGKEINTQDYFLMGYFADYFKPATITPPAAAGDKRGQP